MSVERTFIDMVSALKEQIKLEVLQELRTEVIACEDRRLNIDEAAAYLGVSKETLYRLCKEKQIEHIPIGVSGSKKPRIIFSTFTLDSWMKQKERESVKAAIPIERRTIN